MSKVFIDTSALVALKRASEQEHPAATETLRALVERSVPLVATNHVFAESEEISTAFTFDEHFRHRGLAVIPG